MKALLLFHLRVGARVAIRSAAPLFMGLIVVIMLQMYPAAAFTAVAMRAFSAHPTMQEAALMAAAGLVLPVLAVPQLALGLNGWMRHLPISRTGNRRGLTLALIAVQMPAAIAVFLLAAVAHAHHLPVTVPALRWCVILVAGAFAASPVRRQWLTTPLSLAAAFLPVRSAPWMMLVSIGLLAACDLLAGPARNVRRRRLPRAAGPLLSFKIAWRALGWRTLACCAAGSIPLAAGALFISNNELTGAMARGAGRFAITLAVLVVLAALARRLALRRPPWPLARSFPWSSAQRVWGDAVFLGLHALPLLFAGYWINPPAALEACTLVPFLALRAAGCMRQMPSRRTGAGRFIAEGIFVAGTAALSSWTLPFWLCAAVPAFYAARDCEARQKVTRWLELHYATVGDSLSWGE